MNDKGMNEEQFEALWQRAEAEGYAKRLASYYPEWRAHRRRVAGFTILIVAALSAATPFLLKPQLDTHNDAYLTAYCNRSGISDQYWVDMADELLLEM